MALNGVDPIMFFFFDTPLTEEEYKELNLLKGVSGKSDEQLIRYNELNASIDSFNNTAWDISGGTPIILNADLLQFVTDSYRVDVSKEFRLIEGQSIPEINNSSSTVGLNFIAKTYGDTATAALMNALLGAADYFMAKPEIAPRVSFFGGNIVIDKGYLINAVRAGKSDDGMELIGFTILKHVSPDEEKDKDKKDVVVKDTYPK